MPLGPPPSASSSFGALTGMPGDNTALAAALAANLNLTGGTMTGALAVTPGTLATTGLRLAQTWNAAGTTCRGLEVAITNTNSAAASTLFRVCGGAAGATEFFGINAAGWITGPATGTMVIAPSAGNNLNLYPTGGGNVTASGQLAINAGAVIAEGQNVALGTTTGTKWGASTSQKQAWWNATPVVQQVLATGSTTDQVITLLQTLGLCRQS